MRQRPEGCWELSIRDYGEKRVFLYGRTQQDAALKFEEGVAVA